MNDYMESVLECDIRLNKIDHVYKSFYESFNIRIQELNVNKMFSEFVTESTYDVVYEKSLSDLVSTVVKAIEQFISNIVDFIKLSKDKIVFLFTDKKNKEKLDNLEKVIDEVEIDKTVEIDTSEEDEKKMLDEYIREMSKLERELMGLKLENKTNPLYKSNQYMVEYMEIEKKMDKLNDKFDKAFLEKNEKIIKMAAKDAIRFSKKQLDNVKVDYDALEKKSSDILKEFKKDANGCEVPVKLNMLQKMSRSIATRTRKSVQRMTSRKHGNIAAVIAITVGAVTIKHVARNPEVLKKVAEGGKKINDALDAKIQQLENDITTM